MLPKLTSGGHTGLSIRAHIPTLAGEGVVPIRIYFVENREYSVFGQRKQVSCTVLGFGLCWVPPVVWSADLAALDVEDLAVVGVGDLLALAVEEDGLVAAFAVEASVFGCVADHPILPAGILKLGGGILVGSQCQNSLRRGD